MITPVQRKILSVLLLIGSITLLFFYTDHRSISTWTSYRSSSVFDLRLDQLRSSCRIPNPFDLEYGRANIRLSRAYQGSHYRLEQFILKALRGEPITISAIGGSVTKGHQVQADEIYFYKLEQWLAEFLRTNITSVNGAQPATGSDYFSFCFPLHIPQDSDLVIVELAINDQGIPEHVENMENLLRGLLDLPHKPAVILAEAVAFSNGGMGGGGGRMHLPVAQYYDVPVIKWPLVNHFARYPDLVPTYFAKDWWQNPDTRHINAHGHRDLAMLIASLIRDAACLMAIDGTSAEKHIQVRPSQPESETGEMVPGIWEAPEEYALLPRLKVLEGWNPDAKHVTPPFYPTCLSTRSKDPAFNLTPMTTEGWDHWTHPDFQDKPYLIARQPGSRVSFRLQTQVGVVKMYSLRSRTFGLGTVQCWANDEEDKITRIEGYWDNDSNIGRFSTIREGLPPGEHLITCELLEQTADPNGGHEFRIISMMR